MSASSLKRTRLKAPVLALVFLATVVLMVVANPAEALAGEARVDVSGLGAKLVYEDDATNNTQDNNDVTIDSPSFGTYTVHDAGEPLSAGPGCAAIANDPYTVTCSDVRINSILVDVWRGPDEVAINVATNATIYGGSGEDYIYGGNANDTIHSDRSCLVSDSGCTTRTVSNSGTANIFDDVVYANGGNDNIEGGTDDDELYGGAGDDTIDGDAPDLVTKESTISVSCEYCGDDLLNGGSGADGLRGNEETDTADYSERTAGVTVTLDDQANDGAPGEGDSVGTTVGWTYDIERVVGGGGNDSLTGDHHGNHLQGRGGTDSLDGGGGTDSLDGGDGADSLYGGEHDDTLMPGTGVGDGIVGGNGADLASYSERTAAVNVSLDGNANDGEAGENDNVVGDVEAVAGGSGGDTLTGGTYRATLYGNGGNDNLRGGSANDRLEGEAGNDILDGHAGGDFMSGGDGSDRADYSSRSADLTITLDEGTSQDPSQPDGEAAEGDDVRPDVEVVWGGSGGDKIAGADADLIVNGGGDDRVVAHTLLGNAGDDDLDGGDGDDVLQGGEGNDVLVGWRGADTLAGGNGSDTVSARDHDSATIDLAAQTLTGTVVRYEEEACEVWGTCWNEIHEQDSDAFSGVENAAGSPGDDALIGSSGNNSLDGAGGADTLEGGFGADTIKGGDGTDTVDFSKRNISVDVSLDDIANDADSDAYGNRDNVGSDVERVIGTASSDTLVGSVSANTLEGGAGNDTLRGEGGDDTLDAGDGNDTLDGGPGAEAISGGNGTDIADYSARTANVSVSLDGQANDGEAGEADDVVADIETILGGSGADTLAGGADRERLEGRGGDDALNGAGGNDLLFGGSGGDDLNGGDGADDQVDYGDHDAGVTVTQDGVANDGNASDERGGAGGRDNVAGDVEEVQGSAFNDNLSGSGGRDELGGSNGNDMLNGLGGDDDLIGSIGNDTLNGGDGNDDFWGDWYLSGSGGGADTFNGGDGQDLASWVNTSQNVTVKLDGLSNDGLSGEGDNVKPDVEDVVTWYGNDTLVGSAAANDLDSGYGNDTLDGGDGDDTLTASNGIDILTGGTGADVMSAGDGSDFVTGGPGGDTMGGGAGADTANYDEHSSAVNLDFGANSGPDGDTLVGFENARGGSGNDKLLGDDADNQLEGGPGDDTLDGRGGADLLAGGDDADTADYTGREQGVSVSLDGVADDGSAGEGDNVDDVETVLGTPSNDTLFAAPERGSTLVGNAGDDYLAGSSGADILKGGGGQDSFDPGDGDDAVRMRDDIEEEVSCGPGADLAGIDHVDTAAEDCETVEVADPPSPAIDDPTVTEGVVTGDGTAARAVFTVSLSSPADETVNAAYATADGTALAGEDYEQVEGTLTFVPGDTVEKVSVPIIDNEEPESAENFHVDLLSGSGVTISKDRGTATIADDDNRLHIDDVTVAEGNDGMTNARFTVSLSVEASALVAVTYATRDGTATAPDDYAATSGTLAFAVGDSTRTITVPVVGDGFDEPDETFTVELSNVRGAAIDDGQAQGTITDDDPPSDMSSPDTTITGGPFGPTDDDTPTFTFGGSDDRTARADLIFSYKVDNSGWSAYSSATSATLASLPDGPHTFHVKARDEAGNEDASPAEQSFTVDTTAPTVQSAAPTGKKVSPKANVVVTFSEAVEASTVDATTFKLVKKGSSTLVAAGVTVSPDGKSAKLDPTRNLKRGATYAATVTTGVEDQAGNALDHDPSTTGSQPKTWSFKVRR